MADDRDARATLVRTLFGAGNRTPSAEVVEGYLATLRRMDTPTFARLVERILEGLEHATDAEPFRVPTAKELWHIRRNNMRLPNAPTDREPEAEQWSGDGWDINANLLLLAYVTDPQARRGARFAPDSVFDPKARDLIAGPITRALTAVLVKWKNAWARDMREDRADGGKLDGKASWAACMKSAEAEIDRLIASERAA